jgi:hypothetical protein
VADVQSNTTSGSCISKENFERSVGEPCGEEDPRYHLKVDGIKRLRQLATSGPGVGSAPTTNDAFREHPRNKRAWHAKLPPRNPGATALMWDLGYTTLCRDAKAMEKRVEDFDREVLFLSGVWSFIDEKAKLIKEAPGSCEEHFGALQKGLRETLAKFGQQTKQMNKMLSKYCKDELEKSLKLQKLDAKKKPATLTLHKTHTGITASTEAMIQM